MAWQLTDEVQRLCPRGLSAGERAVLGAVASAARLPTRSWDMTRQELAQRAGLSASGLRAAVRRLRDHGVELRVPIPGLEASDGRPMYGVHGQKMRWYLPPMAEVAEVLSAALTIEKLERAAARHNAATPDEAATVAEPSAPAAPAAAAGPEWPPAALAEQAAAADAQARRVDDLEARLAAQQQTIAELQQRLEHATALAAEAFEMATRTTAPAEPVVHSRAADEALAAVGKGGTTWRQGGHEVALRGTSDAPPSVLRKDVPAPPRAREAAGQACGQPADKGGTLAELAPVPPFECTPPVPPFQRVPPSPPSPPRGMPVTWLELVGRMSDAPPRCPLHDAWPSRRRPPDCGDCAALRKSWDGQRTELNRAEARARRDCPHCDEHGWRLDVDPAAPVARCRSTYHGPPPPPGASPASPQPAAAARGRHRRADTPPPPRDGPARAAAALPCTCSTCIPERAVTT